jgi:hypothetical protein
MSVFVLLWRTCAHNVVADFEHFLARESRGMATAAGGVDKAPRSWTMRAAAA